MRLAFSNPIVRYAVSRMQVDDLSVDLLKQDTLSLTFVGGRTEEARLPEAVQQFLDAFNRGSYPDLELPPDQV